MFSSAMVFSKGMPKLASAGDGWLGQPVVTRNSTDSNQTIGLAAFLGGVWSHTVSTARNDTTPPAADIIAALPNWGIGDSFLVYVSAPGAGTVGIVGGTGVTVQGAFSVPVGGSRWLQVTKTSATTITITAF